MRDSDQHLFVDIAQALMDGAILQRQKYAHLPDEEFQKEMTIRKAHMRLNDFLEKVSKACETPCFITRSYQVQQLLVEHCKPREKS